MVGGKGKTPIRLIARLAHSSRSRFSALLRDHITQRIHQGHDIADHGQGTGDALNPLQGDHAATDFPQPGIEHRCAAGDVFYVDDIERDDGHLRDTFFCSSNFRGHESISLPEKLAPSRANVKRGWSIGENIPCSSCMLAFSWSRNTRRKRKIPESNLV